MYKTEVLTKSLPVKEWLDRYCFPGRFLPLCGACPDYGRVWSCPPDAPSAADYLSRFQTAVMIGVKVCYGDELRAAAATPEATERLRGESYGVVKKALLETMLALEKEAPGSLFVAAGRCEQCARCTRPEGLPCRRPERLRYSFSAFGFDLTAMAEELLHVRLLWAPEGLPEYNMALAAFLMGEAS